MQSTTRCPRCGYLLTFSGSAYYCSFCGYPRTHEPLTLTLHSLEKKVSDRIQSFLAELKPRVPSQPSYYPVNVIMQPCINCGFIFPRMGQVCPSCGRQRAIVSQDTRVISPTETPDLDRRVFDYISAHGGTISLSQAAQDLAITQANLRTSIERLKTGGFLSQS
jgi:predicted amidophosphoribosyltransferase